MTNHNPETFEIEVTRTAAWSVILITAYATYTAGSLIRERWQVRKMRRHEEKMAAMTLRADIVEEQITKLWTDAGIFNVN